MERLGAESAREHVRWVIAFWYVSSVLAILLAYDVFTEILDCSVTLCDRSETGRWRAQAPTPDIPISVSFGV